LAKRVRAVGWFATTIDLGIRTYNERRIRKG